MSANVETEDAEAILFLLEEFDQIKFYMSSEHSKLIVTEENQKYIFDVSCTETQTVLPNCLEDDFDGDGENEIALCVLTGTGTGICIWSYYVLDHDQNGALVLNEFKQEDMVSQMEEHFSYTYDEDKKEVQYYMDGEAVGDPIGIFQDIEEEESYTFSEVSMDEYVNYDVEDGVPKVTASLFGWLNEILECPSFVLGNLTAEVMYSEDGSFTLNNISLIDME